MIVYSYSVMDFGHSVLVSSIVSAHRKLPDKTVFVLLIDPVGGGGGLGLEGGLLLRWRCRAEGKQRARLSSRVSGTGLLQGW